MTRKSILEEFLGTDCPTCDGVKRPKQSHCGRCYHQLPKGMQRALYLRFGEGYEEAYAAACAYLAEHHPRPAKTGDLFK